jgi:hypothetical protein
LKIQQLGRKVATISKSIRKLLPEINGKLKTNIAQLLGYL